MPNINELRESKFLKKEDAGNGILVTISGCVQENVGIQGQPEELKWCLTFEESKPMVLNSTNGQVIAGFLGSDNTDDWVGKKIVLFNDPSVMYAGKRIGGLRARAPRNRPAAVQQAPQTRAVQPPSSATAAREESFESAQPVRGNRPAPTATGQAFDDAGTEEEVNF